MPNQVMTDQPSRKRKRGTEERDTAPIGKGMDVPSYGVDILRGCKKTIQSDHIGGQKVPQIVWKQYFCIRLGYFLALNFKTVHWPDH